MNESLDQAARAGAVDWSAARRTGSIALAGQDVRYLPGATVPDGDPCGAGDRFAASAALALAHR